MADVEETVGAPFCYEDGFEVRDGKGRDEVGPFRSEDDETAI